MPNCGCFGVFWARPLSGATLIEDLVMAGLSILAWKWAGSASPAAGEVAHPSERAASTQR